MFKSAKRKDRIRRWMAARPLPIAVAVLAMLLVAGTLGTGIQFDDHIHRMKLEQPHMWPSEYGSIVGLFAFGSGVPEQVQQAMEFGMVPWWTSKVLKAAFFRPVTALTHWIDYRFWPKTPSLMHLQSILWFGALVLIAALVYRRFMTPLWIAGLAALLFAIDDAHGIPAGWLANRNALIAGVFGLLSLICHDRWRREGWQAGAVCGPLLFLLGLLSTEAGLGAGAYLVAYEVFLGSGGRRRRLMGLVPYLVVGGAWYGLYLHLGFGTGGGGAYIDPAGDPAGYLKSLAERLPALLYGQWMFPNAGVYGMLPKPAAYWVLGAACVVLAGLAAVLAPVIRRDVVAKFWALGMLLSLLPVSATFPDNRLLIFCGLGAMGLLAKLLAVWFDKADWLPASRMWKSAAAVYVCLLVVIHFIAAPLFLPLQSRGVARMSRLTLEQPVRELAGDIDFYGKRLIFVNPPIPFALMHMRFICRQQVIPAPDATRVLASGLSSDLTISRIDARTLDIEAAGGYITNAFDRLYRGKRHPMAAGQRVELSDMTAEVLTLTRDQRPLKVRFTFDRPLDDPSMHLYCWQDARFVAFVPPAVGETARLARVDIPL